MSFFLSIKTTICVPVMRKIYFLVKVKDAEEN